MRLMRQIGLQGVRRGKTFRTAFADGAQTEWPLDLAEHRFAASMPD